MKSATAEPQTDLLDVADAPPVSQALAPKGAEVVSMFERLASDPNVSVEKLERLIAMNERVLAHNAKSAFDAAFAVMQPKIPQIDEKGAIKGRGGEVRSTYARLEDIHDVVKPILATHGFAMRHRTEWPEGKDGTIRIIGILSHRDGHSEESTFEAPMDRSEFRTDIQSMGSTVSYGRRYTTLDLLNISTRGMDVDGSKSGRPQPPEGYDDWKLSLSKKADEGIQALEKAFASGDVRLRNYLTGHDAIDLAKMRTRARTGKAAQA